MVRNERAGNRHALQPLIAGGPNDDDDLLSPPASLKGDGNDSNAPPGSGIKRRRRAPSASSIIQALFESQSEAQRARLNFDMETATKNFELRRLEMKEATERHHAEMKFRAQESERLSQQWQKDMDQRMLELENRRDAEKSTNDRFRMDFELKMKQFELLLKKSNKQTL